MHLKISQEIDRIIQVIYQANAIRPLDVDYCLKLVWRLNTLYECLKISLKEIKAWLSIVDEFLANEATNSAKIKMLLVQKEVLEWVLTEAKGKIIIEYSDN